MTQFLYHQLMYLDVKKSREIKRNLSNSLRKGDHNDPASGGSPGREPKLEFENAQRNCVRSGCSGRQKYFSHTFYFSIKTKKYLLQNHTKIAPHTKYR